MKSLAFQTTALGDELIKLRESMKCTFVVPYFEGIVKKGPCNARSQSYLFGPRYCQLKHLLEKLKAGGSITFLESNNSCCYPGPYYKRNLGSLQKVLFLICKKYN